MSIRTRLNPRAGYWRGLKIAKSHKIISLRALERDVRPQNGSPRRACMRRAAARAFWQRDHPWVSRAI